MNIHSNARTTPQIRREIQQSASKMTLDDSCTASTSAAQLSRNGVNFDAVEDRSHRPHRLKTALSPTQEEIVVLLRRTLLLAVDDLLVVVREFLHPKMVRSSLLRLLGRHGVNNLRVLIAEQSDEQEKPPPKT